MRFAFLLIPLFALNSCIVAPDNAEKPIEVSGSVINKWTGEPVVDKDIELIYMPFSTQNCFMVGVSPSNLIDSRCIQIRESLDNKGAFHFGVSTKQKSSLVLPGRSTGSLRPNECSTELRQNVLNRYSDLENAYITKVHDFYLSGSEFKELALKPCVPMVQNAFLNVSKSESGTIGTTPACEIDINLDISFLFEGNANFSRFEKIEIFESGTFSEQFIVTSVDGINHHFNNLSFNHRARCTRYDNLIRRRGILVNLFEKVDDTQPLVYDLFIPANTISH